MKFSILPYDRIIAEATILKVSYTEVLHERLIEEIEEDEDFLGLNSFIEVQKIVCSKSIVLDDIPISLLQRWSLGFYFGQFRILIVGEKVKEKQISW